MGYIHITKYCCLVTKSCLTLFYPVDCSPAGVSCYFLLQRIFPTKGSNTYAALQVDTLPLSH